MRKFQTLAEEGSCRRGVLTQAAERVSSPSTGSLIQLSDMYTIYTLNIGLDKSGYQVNSFLISQRKHVMGTH